MLRESTRSQEEGSQSFGRNQQGRSRSRSRGLSAGENRNEPKAEPPHRAKKWPPLNWIPGPEEEFPVHLAVGMKAHAFILWVENYKLNLECYEVQALQFIPNHVEVTGKIVAWVMWALVYGMMGRTPSGARLNCRAGGHRSPRAVSRRGHIPNEAGGTGRLVNPCKGWMGVDCVLGSILVRHPAEGQASPPLLWWRRLSCEPPHIFYLPPCK